MFRLRGKILLLDFQTPHQCTVFQRLLAALHIKLPPKLNTNPPNVAAASSNLVFVPPQSQSSSSSDLQSTRSQEAEIPWYSCSRPTGRFSELYK